jgi:MFS family permease
MAKLLHRSERLPRRIAVLGSVSLLTAISSAMIYSLLPVFLVKVIGASAASVGLIEGLSEGMISLAKIGGGVASDWMRRRKPVVLLGYAISAAIKVLFPLAESLSVVLAARVVDRVGKGLRDGPRDAFVADITPARMRGAGYGLRISFYTTGFVVGPLASMGLMVLSGDDFRLVFCAALVPAALAIAVLLLGIRESARKRRRAIGNRALVMQLRQLRELGGGFWWAIAIASLLSVARFSQAFLVLQAYRVGLDAAFVPIMLVMVYVIYALTAYPFGVLADRGNQRLQLGLGALVLVAADMVLAAAGGIWTALCGAALWGLQLAMTQGLLAVLVAGHAPKRIRATAFGTYEFAVGVAGFIANAGAGALWLTGGPAAAFGTGAAVAAGAVLLLMRPLPAPR